MSSSSLLRWGGLAAVASALFAISSLVLYLVVVGGDRNSEAATSAVFFLPSGAQLLAMVLLLVGLVALFARQAERFGVLRVAGFVLATGLWVLALFAQAYRCARVSGPVQRQQIKWLVFGAGVMVA